MLTIKYRCFQLSALFSVTLSFGESDRPRGSLDVELRFDIVARSHTFCYRQTRCHGEIFSKRWPIQTFLDL